MSGSVVIASPGLPAKDAAMSLCAMGHDMFVHKQKVNDGCHELISQSPSHTDLRVINVVEDDESRIFGFSGNTAGRRRIKGKLPPKKRLNSFKAKESKRDPKVSFEEMKRLMRVYGPTKCLRNRTPKEGNCAKILSVKRKFYRWFPDFHERFVLQSPGEWYRPKIGHEQEMKFREELRKKDQQLLAAKRNAKKTGSKIEPTPQA
eukprot:CAMPEP_0172548272 /NCGR_PEP_ID=MMETSP1067-20121228/17609_1 /TAXON_ID=265564 ORGANISM="Thalassiosira punctigera, Strain Tpunct2005C2" /NCGR_SAMPLE_ID=MMETSP1067 /ASSEMBLY_ACC=CAM_ASM_000444 /LENGTH=203 /DNA_ID=CAMNT_0013335471 /DNA_START=133 /DNA_END=744 /DNA_ORIENTATION=-